MEETLRLSEIDKMIGLGDKEKTILKMVNSKPFRWWLKYILKDGQLVITPEKIEMNGKPFSNMLFNTSDQKKLKENGINEILMKKDQFYVKMGSGDSYNILID